MWVPGVNYEFIEINTPDLLQMCCNNCLHTETSAKSDLEPLQHHKMNTWCKFRACFLKHVNWLVSFQKPLSTGRTRPGMISGPCICRKYIAGYGSKSEAALEPHCLGHHFALYGLIYVSLACWWYPNNVLVWKHIEIWLLAQNVY